LEESTREATGDDVYKAGDYCRVVNYKDSSEYEARIQSMGTTDEGMQYFTVKFLGYNEFDNVWLSELKPSQGKKARALARSMSTNPNVTSSSESDIP